MKPAISLGAVVLTAALATAPSAHAVQRRDAAAIDALYRRALTLTQGLTDSEGKGVSQLNATGDARTLDCTETLREASNQVTNQLMDVNDVAALAAGLRHPADRRYGGLMTAKSITRALGILPVEARQTNKTAGLCLTEAVVQDEARDQLLLINDATAQLGQIRARLWGR